MCSVSRTSLPVNSMHPLAWKKKKKKDQTDKQKPVVNEIQTEEPIIVHTALVNKLKFQSSFSSK